MKVKVMKKHPGEGQFPAFPKGTAVELGNECGSFPGWYACTIDGYSTYVPDLFVCNGKLTRDYNPTEFVAEVGDIFEVKEIVYSWLLVVNSEGVAGWIPAEAVVSV